MRAKTFVALVIWVLYYVLKWDCSELASLATIVFSAWIKIHFSKKPLNETGNEAIILFLNNLIFKHPAAASRSFENENIFISKSLCAHLIEQLASLLSLTEYLKPLISSLSLSFSPTLLPLSRLTVQCDQKARSFFHFFGYFQQ